MRLIAMVPISWQCRYLRDQGGPRFSNQLRQNLIKCRAGILGSISFSVPKNLVISDQRIVSAPG